jgi:hypothetical protein
MTAILTLGSIVFKGTEIPDRLPFGGEQMLAEHRMIGGAKEVQAMGPSDEPLAWSGWFYGPDAIDRAMALDALRKGGQAQELVFSKLRYRVVVQRFVADLHRDNDIPYSISCVVQEDLTAPIAPSEAATVDQMMVSDMSTANVLGNRIGDSTLTGLLGTLSTAVSSVSNFASASRATINSVLQPLAAVRGQVNTLIASTANTLSNVTTLGGIVPFNPAAQAASTLTSQVVAMTQSGHLYDLNAVLGRMGRNASAAGTSGASVIMAGGDLYHAAATAYGNASGWTTIAKANNLTDPVVSGLQTLRIPPTIDNTGGVLAP